MTLTPLLPRLVLVALLIASAAAARRKNRPNRQVNKRQEKEKQRQKQQQEEEKHELVEDRHVQGQLERGGSPVVEPVQRGRERARRAPEPRKCRRREERLILDAQRSRTTTWKKITTTWTVSNRHLGRQCHPNRPQATMITTRTITKAMTKARVAQTVATRASCRQKVRSCVLTLPSVR